MIGEWIAAGVVCFALAGCAAPVPADKPTIAGQYELTGFEGSRNLPCCREVDASGTVVTIVGGVLQVGWNTPSGTYTWYLVRRYDYADGTSRQVQSRYSTGTYTWDGRTLMVMDSEGRAPLTAVVTTGVVMLQNQDHQYEFLELIQLPH